MRVTFFGTYDAARHPRVRVLQEGLAGWGDEVAELNMPLGDTTEARVGLLRRPWRAPAMLLRIGRCWWTLARRARCFPDPEAVVVGYAGHLDVHLARRLWPSRPIVLDQLAFASDTAADRGAGSRLLVLALDWLDRRAVAAADLVIVDTPGSRELMPPGTGHKGVVVAVGASDGWFRQPEPRSGSALGVVFFGLYTPLQGAPVIGRAIGLLAGTDVRFTMIGTGQDLQATRREAGANQRVTWLDWVEPERLPEVVAGHDVCLGIFGTGPKALRVVPNKVFQGAAAGCAVVTSDTPAQREALGEAAVYVPPGDAHALAEVLAGMVEAPGEVWSARLAAFTRADRHFRGRSVVAPLRRALAGRV
ncbi:MAG: glycosyltransferase [Acidimicrobiia bacterium]